jgi:hypothetical protein
MRSTRERAAKCRCTGQGGGTATPAPGTVRCPVFRRGALSFDAVPCLTVRWTVFRRPAQPAHLRKLASLAARRVGVRRLGHAQAVCVRTFGTEGLFWKGSFGSALVVPVGFWEDFSSATAPSSSPRRFPTPLTLNPKLFTLSAHLLRSCSHTSTHTHTVLLFPSLILPSPFPVALSLLTPTHTLHLTSSAAKKEGLQDIIASIVADAHSADARGSQTYFKRPGGEEER